MECCYLKRLLRWAKDFRAKHLKQNHISEANFCSIHSASKLDWIRARELLLQHYKFIVNHGCSKFWWDTWIGDCPLKSFLSPAVWRRLQNKHTTVREVLQNRDHSAWRPIRCHLPAEIREALEVMPIPSKQEALISSFGSLQQMATSLCLSFPLLSLCRSVVHSGLCSPTSFLGYVSELCRRSSFPLN